MYVIMSMYVYTHIFNLSYIKLKIHVQWKNTFRTSKLNKLFWGILNKKYIKECTRIQFIWYNMKISKMQKKYLEQLPFFMKVCR